MIRATRVPNYFRSSLLRWLLVAIVIVAMAPLIMMATDWARGNQALPHAECVPYNPDQVGPEVGRSRCAPEYVPQPDYFR